MQKWRVKILDIIEPKPFTSDPFELLPDIPQYKEYEVWAGTLSEAIKIAERSHAREGWQDGGNWT